MTGEIEAPCANAGEISRHVKMTAEKKLNQVKITGEIEKLDP